MLGLESETKALRGPELTELGMPMVSQEVDELELSKPIKPRVYRAGIVRGKTAV